jgi:hypothetical protein
MNAGSSIPYRLRQNKSVDRELFLAFLGRLSPTLNIESYRYIGLGGPFLEDFRLIHARLGITDLKCIESEESVHKRQLFNCPVNSIECINDNLEDYIDSTDFKEAVIIWFDYTDPGEITEQIESFARTVSAVPVGSILRVTLNANPTSLGKPDNSRENVQQWRLGRFRERLGSLFPSGLQPGGMTYKNYGRSVLRVLYLAVEKELLSSSNRNVIWSLATHYADGQPMTTATLIVCDRESNQIDSLVRGWEFFSTPDDPFLLDMPALSTLERLTMESSEDAKERLGFELPKSDMGEDPFDSFKKFYRFFPHFSRVEL